MADSSTTSSPNVKTTETPSPTKAVSKSRYSSCLSSFRNNYKPPATFKPENVSSPVIVTDQKPREPFSSPSVSNLPSTPNVLPQIASLFDVPVLSPVRDETGQGSPRFGDVSLTGKGGNWRGPNQSDMTPENQGRQQFRQGGAFRNSRGGRDSYMGGLNSSTPNQPSFGRNNRDGNNSFNSSQGGFSPHNSPRNNSSNNRGNNGSFRKTPSVDISSYYSPAMTQDPWADLVKRRKLVRDSANYVNNSNRNQ